MKGNAIANKCVLPSTWKISEIDPIFKEGDLKIGSISLIFHVDGKTHLLAIVLKSRYRDLEIEQLSFFKRVFSRLSGPLALLISKFSRIFSFSVVVKW